MAHLHRWGPQASEETVYDLVGIGFGPSNLALAATIEEEGERICGRRPRCLFFERRGEFAWHPGLLLAGARVQLSFLKDLVTLRNPRSRFTFLNYLRERERLDQFANLRNFFPTRREFNDYYRWAAEQLRGFVRYGQEVSGIEPVAEAAEPDAAGVELLRVHVRAVADGAAASVLARNLVLAVGGTCYIPGGIDIRASRRTFHAQDLLPRLAADFRDRDRPYRFVVVGSGQTAAEVFQHLLGRYPAAEVTAAVRRFAFKPADESHFVNEIFFPEMVDLFYGLAPEQRRALLAAHADTNYSAVDLDLIQEIYEELYQQRIDGEARGRILRFLELRSLVDHDSKVVVHFEDVAARRPVVLEADAVVLATGYLRPDRPELLAPLAAHLEADGDRYRVARDYRIHARDGFRPRVFLQGFCESTHGISDTLLSNLATRSLEILRAVAAAETAGAAAAAGEELPLVAREPTAGR
jgi:L-ornithine N5-oxygenase